MGGESVTKKSCSSIKQDLVIIVIKGLSQVFNPYNNVIFDILTLHLLEICNHHSEHLSILLNHRDELHNHCNLQKRKLEHECGAFF